MNKPKSLMPDLRCNTNALRARKYPLQVHVDFATQNGSCSTLEGIVNYEVGDAIITGILGERWPVAREIFDRNYIKIHDQDMNDVYQKRPIVIYALQLDRATKVCLGVGLDCICAQKGDWLLQYEKDHYGVVNETIFHLTYEILNFE